MPKGKEKRKENFSGFSNFSENVEETEFLRNIRFSKFKSQTARDANPSVAPHRRGTDSVGGARFLLHSAINKVIQISNSAFLSGTQFRGTNPVDVYDKQHRARGCVNNFPERSTGDEIRDFRLTVN